MKLGRERKQWLLRWLKEGAIAWLVLIVLVALISKYTH